MLERNKSNQQKFIMTFQRLCVRPEMDDIVCLRMKILRDMW